MLDHQSAADGHAASAVTEGHCATCRDGRTCTIRSPSTKLSGFHYLRPQVPMLVEPRAESGCPTCRELSRGFSPGVAPDAAGARPACAAALRPGPRPAESARHPVPDQRRQRGRDRIDDPPQRPFSEPVGRAQPHCGRFVQQPVCQSAFNPDPRSACKIDPPEWHGGGCPGSQ